MNTQAINNPLGIVSTPASSKQDAAAPSDAGAFNQVLSREIADRSNGSPAEVAKNTQKDGSGNGEKTKDTKSDSAAATSESVKSQEQDQAAAISDKKGELDAQAVTASAELLAFVAALTQANTATPAAVTPSDTPLATTATAKISDIDSAVDTTLGAATAATDSEKDALGKKSDFVAALDKATTGDKGKTASAAAPVKVEVELAATAAVVKGSEPAAVSNPQAVAALNSAALQQLNNTQAAQSAKLAPQVGSPGWDQALGQKVVWMVQGAQQSATLTLNPPDLGPLQVTLNVTNNQASANFTAHQPEVRHALEAAMPRLREMLNDAGIQLGQSSVSAGSSNQQNAFSDQRQNGRQAGNGGTAADPVIHISHVPVPASGSGIVDTFA